MKRVIKASNSDVMNNMIEEAKAIVTDCLGDLGITVGNISISRGSMLTVDDVSYNGHTYTSQGWPSDVHAHLWSRPFDVSKVDSAEDYKKTSSYIQIVSTVFLYEIYGYEENVTTLQDWATQALNSVADDADGTYVEGSFDDGSVYMTDAEYTGVYSEDRIGHLTLFPRRPLNVYYQGEYNKDLTKTLSGNFRVTLTVEDAMDFLNGSFNYSQMENLVKSEFNEWHSRMPKLLSEIQERDDRAAQAERNFAKLSEYLESKLSEFDFQCEDHGWYGLRGTYSLLGDTYEVSTEVDLNVSDAELKQQLVACYRRIRKSILRRKRNLAKKAQDSAML